MSRITIAASLALALGLAASMAPVAAQGTLDDKKYDKGSKIALQGCVTAAEKKDTYVLTQVREWPPASTPAGKYGPRMYWIDKESKDLKPHLGHTVQLEGKITDVEKSEMDFKAADDDHGLLVKIEGPGRDVVTTPEKAGVNVSALPNKDDIKITLLKLKIDDIKMTSSTCSSTMQ